MWCEVGGEMKAGANSIRMSDVTLITDGALTVTSTDVPRQWRVAPSGETYFPGNLILMTSRHSDDTL